ncbi:hypothetical protein [Lutispora thermophila]|uniref:Uncharacterized protein n=1 Tax=Lutispora thermophila DSM 19022 TaxID=1122184 RepID=A0A1M6BBW6_9FIRM|nr:hypothetical protein [Lutispora thermophila]SHI46212.1 hypothetical protein SAMN02745176_00381 [Lutispora thermophila DSM 19022]
MWILGDELVRFENDDSYKNYLNRRIDDSISLDFSPQDISYIIIDKEQERSEIIKAIKEAKSRFDTDTKELVFSKIISLEQILNDF